MSDIKWLDDKDTLIGALGITILPVKEGCYQARMKVDNRTCQNYGMLNGGASLALAETLCGYASHLLCDSSHIPCGIQVSGNHLCKGKFGSTVTATARAVKTGKKVHVWDVKIKDEDDVLISCVRVTNLIVEKSDN